MRSRPLPSSILHHQSCRLRRAPDSGGGDHRRVRCAQSDRVRSYCHYRGDAVILYPIQTVTNLLAYETGYQGAADVRRLGIGMLRLTVIVIS